MKVVDVVKDPRGILSSINDDNVLINDIYNIDPQISTQYINHDTSY